MILYHNQKIIRLHITNLNCIDWPTLQLCDQFTVAWSVHLPALPYLYLVGGGLVY